MDTFIGWFIPGLFVAWAIHLTARMLRIAVKCDHPELDWVPWRWAIFGAIVMLVSLPFFTLRSFVWSSLTGKLEAEHEAKHAKHS